MSDDDIRQETEPAGRMISVLAGVQTMTVRDKQLAGGAPVQFSFSGCQVTK